jgi:hypothetical protein
MGHQIRCNELRRIAPRLRNLSAIEMAAVEELSARIVNKLLHSPTVALRQRAAEQIPDSELPLDRQSGPEPLRPGHDVPRVEIGQTGGVPLTTVC